MNLFRRWLKFNAVGAMGIAVQLAALAVLKSLLGWNYLLATALAVECAVLHNFIWHERWTWRERTRGQRAPALVLARCLRFHAGAVSMATNLALMRLLVGGLHLHYLAANLLSIAAGSLINFFLSDLWVFSKKRAPDLI